MDRVTLSHLAHQNHFESLLHEKDERFFHIKNKNCIEYKYISRPFAFLNALFKRKSNWLTIGDYNGFEANYLINKNQEATASDISDAFLAAAQSEGLINNFLKINVEQIELSDNSFDYVLCKEAFHHFPRAYLGLYEMIRVAKKAAITIEPIDILAKMPALLLVKNIADRFSPTLINKLWKNRFSFETVGNYIFKISEREVEKIAMGMGFSYIAFKGVNLILNSKIKPEIRKEIPVNKKYWNKLQQKFRLLDYLCKLHIMPYNHLISIIFKTIPDETLINDLKADNYTIIKLPENPYLK